MTTLIHFYNKLWLALSSAAEARIHRHFRQYPQIRLSKVTAVSRAPTGLPGDLSSLELVAAFSLLLARTPLAELIQQLDSFENFEWENKLTPDLFEQLLKTAQSFAYKDLRVETAGLLRLGRALAERQENVEWKARFEGVIHGVYYEKVFADLHHRMK